MSSLRPGMVLLVSVLTGGWLMQQGVAEGAQSRTGSRVFDQVMSLVRQTYVDPVEDDALYESAIEGMIQELGDPNSAFLEAPEADNLSIRTQGEYGGVGLEIVERDGYVTVLSPIPGTPGARAGIRAGDRIVEVDGESMVRKGSDAAVVKLRGQPGTSVAIKIARPGVETAIPFTLDRALIHVLSVPFSTQVAPGIGYIPVQLFAASTHDEVLEAIRELGGTELEGLILDLRGNPGGVLDGGIDIADLFLDPGDDIVETRGRAPGQSQTYSATRTQAFPDLRVAVLVDERSASASEIVAGALQDHDRAVVLGARSWGKGSVQSIYQLSGGSILKLTTARWFTPSGRSIQKPRDEQTALIDGGVLTISGRLASRPDTVTDRPTFTSAAGRVLIGGGGITPDQILVPDTLATEEQLAVRSLYREAGALSTGLFDFIVRYVQETDVQPGFVVGPEVFDELYGYLTTDAGLAVDRSTFDGASRYIRYQLEFQIAEQILGDEGRFNRLRAYDPVLEASVQVLQSAETVGAILELDTAGPNPVRPGRVGAASR